MITVIAAVSCSTVKYIPVTHYETEVRTEKQFVHDSTIVHDSIYVLVKGDTVIQYKERMVYRDRFIHDTLAVHDTIFKELPTPDPAEPAEPVEMPLKWYQKMFIGVGKIASILVVMLILLWLGRRALKP